MKFRKKRGYPRSLPVLIVLVITPFSGVPNSGGASYHLLPVGCPTSNFTSLLLSDQQQQAQLAQCTNAAAQLQRTQQAIQVQAAPQPQQQPQTAQFHHHQQQQQTQVPSQPQQFQQQPQAYIQSQGQTATMLAADMTVSGQPTAAASVTGSAPQFITLAPGAPLKVMAVGPNGQLIQTAGLQQFMPTAAVGMTFNQQPQTLQSAQPTTVAMTSQRRVNTPQQQQTNGRTPMSNTAFFAGTTVSSGTIPLVQTAAGGEDLMTSAIGQNALGSGDEKLVYTAL